MKENLRKYKEPICFYGLRLVRTTLCYAFFALCATISTEFVPFGDPDVVNYDPLTHNLMASSMVLIAFILSTWVFHYYDPFARARFFKKPPEQKHYFSDWFGVLRSYEFLCDAMGLLFMPLIMNWQFLRFLLWFFFGRNDFTSIGQYARYLFTVFPIFLFITSLILTRIRSYFREMRAKKEPPLRLAWLKILAFCLLMYLIFLFPQISGILILVIPITIIAVLYVSFWMLVFFIGSIRALFCRIRWIHRLKKICRKNGYTISQIRRPILSVFLQKDHEAHFTMEANGKRYACKLITSIFRNAQMVFVDETLGYFQSGMYFRPKFRATFYGSAKIKFYHDFEAQADEKFLIVSPRPARILASKYEIAYQTDKKTVLREIEKSRVLDNADKVYDATLYTDQGFLNVLARDGFVPRYR